MCLTTQAEGITNPAFSLKWKHVLVRKVKTFGQHETILFKIFEISEMFGCFGNSLNNQSFEKFPKSLKYTTLKFIQRFWNFRELPVNLRNLGNSQNIQTFQKFPKSWKYTTFKFQQVFGKFREFPKCLGIWEIPQILSVVYFSIIGSLSKT